MVPIYLDYCATTPVDPRVLDVMLPTFVEECGNPGSIHRSGERARQLVDEAREEVSRLVGATPQEILVTSGATESINLAIRGIAGRGVEPFHVITSAGEHKAVLETLRVLEADGVVEVDYLPLDSEGRLSVAAVREAMLPETRLVSVMWANNETGVLNPVSEIGALCQERKVLLFSDATQAVGKVPVDIAEARVDLLAFSAHKFYGPKGVGGLCARREVQELLRPLQTGGGQERGLRAGTLNVPGIVGMGAAAAIAAAEMEDDAIHCERLRDRTERELSELGEVWIHGEAASRLPNVTNMRIADVDGEALVANLNGRVSISTGSACNSMTYEPSHVLLAMGVAEEDALQSVRISVGRSTSERELEAALVQIRGAVVRLRDIEW